MPHVPAVRESLTPVRYSSATKWAGALLIVFIVGAVSTTALGATIHPAVWLLALGNCVGFAGNLAGPHRPAAQRYTMLGQWVLFIAAFVVFLLVKRP